MLRAAALVTVVLAPQIALADPETVESELRELAMPRTDDLGLHAQAFAQVAVDRDEGSIAAGGDFRYRHSRRCDTFRIGGQARLGVADATHASAEQWGSLCIDPIAMEFGHHLEWDVRPALLAPLGLKSGDNRRETVRFHWAPLRAPLPRLLNAIIQGEAKKEGIQVAPMTAEEQSSLPQGDMIIFDVDVNHEILWGPMQPMALHDRAEVAPFRYISTDGNFVLDVFQGGGEFIDDGSMVHFWGLKLDGLELGPLFASGGIGIASGSAGPFVEQYSREVDITSPRALLGLETRGHTLDAHVRATRDVALLADGYVTLDSRIAGGLTFDLASTQLALDGAIAKTEIHAPGSATMRANTGGGSLSATHHLMPHLDATLRVDVARSFYASDVTSQNFTPRWGVAGFAALQAIVAK